MLGLKQSVTQLRGEIQLGIRVSLLGTTTICSLVDCLIIWVYYA